MISATWPQILRLKGENIAVVGDLICDVTHYGKTVRLSPEGAYPVFDYSGDSVTSLGGAGSAAIRAARLGAKVDLFCLTEGAPTRPSYENGLTIKASQIDGWKHPTKERFFNGRDYIGVRLDREPPPPDGSSALLAGNISANHLTNYTAVLVSDYRKGAIDNSVMTMVRRLGRPFVVDGKSTDWKLYKGAACITPNDAEMAAAFNGVPLHAGIVDKLVKSGINACLWTRGAKGARLIWSSGESVDIASPFERVHGSAVGAGDQLAATLAMCMSYPLHQAAEIAVWSASLAVAEGRAITLGELLKHTEGRFDLKDGYKDSRLEAWSEMADYIVFINGVFDLLHTGHLDLVNQALAEGKRRAFGRRVRLIVGVNDFDYISGQRARAKRVVQETKERAAMMAGVKGVDMVETFTADSPARLIGHIKPHLYVRGDDHDDDDAIARLVRGYGGESILTKRIGVTSTSIREKIAEEQRRYEAEHQKAGGNTGG